MKKILPAVFILLMNAGLFAQTPNPFDKTIRNNGKTYLVRLMPTAAKKINGVSVSLVPSFLFWGTDTLTINGVNVEGDITPLILTVASIPIGVMVLAGYSFPSDTNTVVSDYKRQEPNMTINGMSIGTFGAPGEVTLNGASIGAFSAFATKMNGVSVVSVSNLFQELRGLSIAGFLNLASRGKVVQIGFMNICEDCTGIQIGLINKMGKRITPFFNMRRRRSK